MCKWQTEESCRNHLRPRTHEAEEDLEKIPKLIRQIRERGMDKIRQKKTFHSAATSTCNLTHTDTETTVMYEDERIMKLWWSGSRVGQKVSDGRRYSRGEERCLKRSGRKGQKKNNSRLHFVMLTVNNSIFVRVVHCANTMCFCLQSKQKGMSKMLSREKHIIADIELVSWLSLNVG